MYPVLPALDRECIDPDGVSLEPFSDFKVPFGMPILIPLYALERDEKYFEDPLKYNPDRFSPENIKNIPSNTFIPFGIGPRSCIGERMGLIQTKTAICSILKDFCIETNDKTPRKIKLKINANHIQSDDPIFVDFVKDSLY
jgi:cytochrome P450